MESVHVTDNLMIINVNRMHTWENDFQLNEARCIPTIMLYNYQWIPIDILPILGSREKYSLFDEETVKNWRITLIHDDMRGHYTCMDRARRTTCWP